MKKSITYILTILAVGALSACDFGGGESSVVNVEEANTAMLRAVANMTNMSVGSMDVTLTADSALSVIEDYEANEYDWYDSEVNVVIDGSVNVKVNDLWGTSPKAALNVTVNEATVHASDTEETYLDISVTDEEANAYYDGEYAYLDLSQAPSLVEALFGVSESSQEFPTKIKGPAGSVEDLEIPDLTEGEFAPTSSEVDEVIAQMLPIMELLPNVTATTSGGILTIVYELEQDDLPDLIAAAMIEMARMMDEEFPSSIDDSLQAIIDEQVDAILEQIDLEILRIEVQIDTVNNVLKKFEFEVDATINFSDYQYVDSFYNSETSEWDEITVGFENTIDIDSTITLQIDKFSEAVSITFPTDLDDYFDMSEASME